VFRDLSGTKLPLIVRETFVQIINSANESRGQFHQT